MTKPNKSAGSKSPKDSGPKGSKAIADVAHPGTSAPSDTSKSIITHRPMMRDPMVVDEDEKQPEDKAGLTPGKSGGETKITPLSERKDDAPDTTASGAAGDDAKADDEAEAKTGAKAGDKEDRTDPVEKPAEPKAIAADADKPDVADAGDAGDAADAEEPAKDDNAETGDKPGVEPGKDKTVDDAKAAAQAEEDAKTAKLIESRKYFLPINAVEQRRSTQIAVAGVILALILAVAWVDVALDAGLIHLGGIKPVTHIFSN